MEKDNLLPVSSGALLPPGASPVGPAAMATPRDRGLAGKDIGHLGPCLRQKPFEVQKLPQALFLGFLNPRQNTVSSQGIVGPS